MFLTLSAAIHGGLSAGANFAASLPKEEMKFLTALPIELRLGYRFFVKGVEGLFIDPVFILNTSWDEGPKPGYKPPFVDAKLSGVQLRIGKAWKEKRVAVFGLLDAVDFGYQTWSNTDFKVKINIGVGLEWGFSPYASLVANLKLGFGEARAIGFYETKEAVGGGVLVGLEFHSSKYYS